MTDIMGFIKTADVFDKAERRDLVSVLSHGIRLYMLREYAVERRQNRFLTLITFYLGQPILKNHGCGEYFSSHPHHCLFSRLTNHKKQCSAVPPCGSHRTLVRPKFHKTTPHFLKLPCPYPTDLDQILNSLVDWRDNA